MTDKTYLNSFLIHHAIISQASCISGGYEVREYSKGSASCAIQNFKYWQVIFYLIRVLSFCISSFNTDNEIQKCFLQILFYTNLAET
jgi:hypothetical protein